MTPPPDPVPGQVRVILYNGQRFATVDVDRHQLETWPELAVATMDALLWDLYGAAAPGAAR